MPPSDPTRYGQHQQRTDPPKQQEDDQPADHERPADEAAADHRVQRGRQRQAPTETPRTGRLGWRSSDQSGAAEGGNVKGETRTSLAMPIASVRQ